MADNVGCDVNEASKSLSLFNLNSSTECICCQKTHQELEAVLQELKSAQKTVTTRRKDHQSY